MEVISCLIASIDATKELVALRNSARPSTRSAFPRRMRTSLVICEVTAAGSLRIQGREHAADEIRGTHELCHWSSSLVSTTACPTAARPERPAKPQRKG